MHFPKFLIVVLVALPSISVAHIGGHSKSQDADPQFYCGRNLARILAALCYDDVNKRSDNYIGSGSMYDTVLTPYYKEPEITWPWISHHKARELSLYSDRRGKRLVAGVVSECCDKACSINELMSYC